MAERQRRKSDAARRANQVIRSRTLLLMLIFGVGTFAALFIRLYILQIRDHEDLQEQAVLQQTRTSVVTASRGTIYDRNGNALALSASAETVEINPRDIANFVKEQEKSQEEEAAAAAEKGDVYTPEPILDQAYIARGLSRILDVEEETILKLMAKTNTGYQYIKKKVEQDTADEVRRFINGEIDDAGNELTMVNDAGKTVLKSNPRKSPKKIHGVYLDPDSKRYYPYHSLAANVIGFVNADNQGAYGLEAKYDDVLQGTSGLTVTAKTNTGKDMLYQYEQYYDAENGSSLVLTLDSNVQYYLEKGIETLVEKFNAKNGAAGIVMDPKSGAILAMAGSPTFDLEDPSTIYDSKLQAKLDAELADIESKKSTYESEEAYEAAVAAAYSSARGTQWRNRCISDTYEPGSTFKPVTLATALEEGLVTMNSTFSCGGSIMVPGWPKPIRCSRAAGHGTQDLKTATANSCNPAFITIGLKIGTKTYYQYLKSFGFMEKTGVDLPAESPKGIFADEKTFNSNVVSLASYAFGQTFNITPLQLIRAQAACINGGYLYTPYLVEQIVDDDGNVLQEHDSAPVRQVISQETSEKVRECLEYVVHVGSGKNGQVVGYTVGGKTGTADKTGSATESNPKGDLVVSFMCFAPAEDPQVIMLITLDTPDRYTGTYPSGGQMVAPVASSIMSEILPYLGVQPDYSSDSAVNDATVPNCVDLTLEEAKTKLTNAGFSWRTVGGGDTVTDQTPVGGNIVPNDASIILYLGEQKPDTPSVVPNVVGKTAAEANKALTDAGLIMKVAGNTATSSGNVYAITQDKAPDSELEPGSVVKVQFGAQASEAD